MSKALKRVWFGILVVIGPSLLADQSDWAEGDASPAAGATREYYNGAARLPWNHFMGDWHDQQDSPQGDQAYAMCEVVDDDSTQLVTSDVTELVRQWTSGRQPNQGFFLRVISPRGDIRFCSREHQDVDLRPRLILKLTDGEIELEPVADTFLTKSTYRSQGKSEQLRVSASPDNALLRFDLSNVHESLVAKATLRLHSTAQFGSATIGIFRCRQGHDAPPSEPIRGIAANYPSDRGIQDHPAVYFAAGFEKPNWDDRWTRAGIMNVIDPIEVDAARKFTPLVGPALRVRIARGANGALNTLWKFQEQTGEEPLEAYFRYYLRLGEDWNQTLQGGKLPGFSGTYGKSGWGGRRSDGSQGWSARGLFQQSVPAGNPLAGKTPIGTYCYHADMEGDYGTNWLWQIGYRGYLETNRWYAIEQHVKMNTPGKRDGVLRAWVDGQLAFDKRDVRFRQNEKLKIEQVWMNIYHGGTKPSPYDQHAFIDNVVIAKEYIGPLGESEIGE